MALNLCQHAFNQHKLQFIQNLFGLIDMTMILKTFACAVMVLNSNFIININLQFNGSLKVKWSKHNFKNMYLFFTLINHL